MVDLLRGCELPGNRGECNNTEAKYKNETVHVQVTHQSFTLTSVENRRNQIQSSRPIPILLMSLPLCPNLPF